MSRPHKTEQRLIPGAVGQLEAIIDHAEPSQAKKAIAVCCHPHPLHGGTMNNKVVYTLARAQVALGLTAIRFNFRGVGRSEGQYGDGLGEMDDVRAVIAWVKQRFPDHRLWLSGFSFGSWISAAVAHEYPVEQLISIAPPVERGVFEGIKHPCCDWMVIMGDQDEVVSFAATEQWIATLEPRPKWIVFKGAGHFFHSRLVELRETLEQHLSPKAEQMV